MKIGVVSDTHLNDLKTASRLADVLLSGPFSDIDAILHAGDAVIADLENCFYPLPWYAVRGNMDHRLLDLPDTRIVNLAGKRIGLVHGWGPAEDLERRVFSAFPGQQLDALVFGHTHQPLCSRVGSTLLFNPGSATDRRKAERHTVGVLTVEEGMAIIGEIIPIDW